MPVNNKKTPKRPGRKALFDQPLTIEERRRRHLDTKYVHTTKFPKDLEAPLKESAKALNIPVNKLIVNIVNAWINYDVYP